MRCAEREREENEKKKKKAVKEAQKSGASLGAKFAAGVPQERSGEQEQEKRSTK